MNDLRLPEGCVHLKDFVDRIGQHILVDICREHLSEFPLMQPKTKHGYPLALKVSSFGKVGWFGDKGRYEYLERHANGKRWPSIPDEIDLVLQAAVRESGVWFHEEPFEFDTVLLNWYPPHTGKLGRHQDNAERDRDHPIVTISLGDTCLFNIGTPNFKDKGVDINLLSGDVFLMSGKSRMAYHEVKELFVTPRNDLMKNGGRISLTARKVF